MRKELITEIKNLPAKLRSVVNGLTDEQLNTPYGEGKWTAKQVVHHLVDSHMHAYLRMKFFIAEDHPTIKTYNQEDWAKFDDAKNHEIESSLKIIEGLHSRWSSFLLNLTENDFQKTAFHPERGEVTLDSMVKMYAEHGNKHVGHIQSLRNTKGW